MSLNDYMLTDGAIAENGVVAAPDRLTGTAAQNKMLFDRLIRDTVKDLYNGALEALGGENGAAEIGFADARFSAENAADALAELMALINEKLDIAAFNIHQANRNNPHRVTAAQVGLGSVDNTADLDKPVSAATQAALNAKQDALTFDATPTVGSANPVTSGGVAAAVNAKLDIAAFNIHQANRNNPHRVTAAQVGLGSVDNTADLDKPVSAATQTALDAKQDALTFDATPTVGSTNPVTSGGIADAVGGKAPAIYASASGAVASFDDGAGGMPLKSLAVTVLPAQAGEGTPSPDNIRPISGWTGCVLSHSGADTSDPDTLTVTFPAAAGTVYGGTLDLTTGRLSVDRIGRTFAGASDESWSEYGEGANRYFRFFDYRGVPHTSLARGCSHFANVSIASGNTNVGYYATTGTGSPHTRLQFRPANIATDFPTVSSWRAWLAEQAAGGTPLTCWWRTAAPVAVYQLDPATLRALPGSNRIWADCGDVAVSYPADSTAVLAALEARVAALEARDAASEESDAAPEEYPEEPEEYPEEPEEYPEEPEEYPEEPEEYPEEPEEP